MNWAFQNPWLLLGSLVAIVPLILFWLRRRSPQQVEWAAMQFLQDALRTSASRRKLKQWLLLAVRIALPVMIALVAATPGCINQNVSSNHFGDTATRWILVFDVSASMGSRVDGTTNLNEAITAAKRIVEDCPPGDRISIVSSGVNDPQTLITTADRATILRNLDALTISDGSFLAENVLGLVSDLIDESEFVEFLQTQIVVFSDFAERDWQFDSLNDSLKLATESKRDVQVQLVPCGQPTPNIAIREIKTFPNTATRGQTVQCRVTVNAVGYDSETQTTIELLIDGQTLGSQSVSIEPGESAEAAFTVPTSQVGTLEIEAVIPMNGLLIDDRRYRTVEVRPEINVLCVEGHTGAAKSFLAATTAIPNSSLPSISPVVIDLSQLTEVNLDSIDVLVMLGCGQLDESQITLVSDQVKRGTGLCLGLGPEIDVPSWQSLLESVSNETNAIQLTNQVSSGDFRLDPLGYKHPMMKDFRNQPQAGLTDVPIKRYRQIRFDSVDSQSVLKFDNGEPALISWNHQRGAVLIATTPLHSVNSGEPWNQLPAWWSYVPLVNNATVWLFGASGYRYPLSLGDQYELNLNNTLLASSVLVETPSKTSQSSQIAVSEDGRAVVLLTAQQPGFVRVKTQGSVDQSVAFNVSPREQDSRRSDMAKLRSRFPATASNTTTPSSVKLRSTRSDRAFFVGLIMIACLLLAEPLLANRKRNSAPRIIV